ncbi:MAG: Gfo/Idh/MocA family oxidoreductase, partial [Kiritimatiellia bacterium]|nr:Gfo/Idh/MocA family oxidoreductase [Kiritimatiellia bacterium]
EGGPLVDCGTHQIDLALFWLDSEVTSFTGHGAWVDDYEAPDHLWLHMDHASGAHTVVEMSFAYHHTSRNAHSEFVYELIGTKGVIRYDREQKLFRMENETGLHEFPFHHEKSFEGMYREWSQSLQTGTSDLLTPAETALRITEIARSVTEEAIRSRRSL